MKYNNMNEKDKETLIAKRVELVENIMMEELLTHLIAKGVVTKRNAEYINAINVNSKKVEYFLDLLPKRGPDAFQIFCEALNTTGQEFIVSHYLKEDNKTNDLSFDCIPTAKDNEPSNQLLLKDNDNSIIRIKYSSTSPLKKCNSTPTKSSPKSPEVRHLLKHVISEPTPSQFSLNGNQTGITRCDRIDNSMSPAIEEPWPKKRKVCNEQDIDILKIKPATQEFYYKNHSQSYKMDGIPRGLALVININKIAGMAPREGSSIDHRRMSYLLKQLQFTVISYDNENLTAENILIKVREFKDLPEHKNADATVVCLFSHGTNGYIFGTDGEKVPLNDVFSLFDVDECPDLRKKPKIFIMQSCRGDNVDLRRVPTLKVSAEDFADNVPVQKTEPTMSDSLFCYPTQEGYRAWRNYEEGSWFIQALVDVFAKHAWEKDICAMLNMVNSMVSQRTSLNPSTGLNGAKQMSEFKSTLRKPHLYFYPGIGRKQN
ncbi:caspase-2 isoform X2 [Octopus bimaculoides]|uniref:caspase-2 isoform X2 n=1 Tax=Octopus bimaculoides TaxID=37653 RepID=UPI00071E1E4A|nr:caspase-2 isoform X2 [Octopus bimaculoides]XP_052822110.1 caspase-2 isoform X2 [Octopus bimaculoides]|eukprot:XP_014783598.1 PREDICTED: caspase-2-like isoform X2 [Octopus bimaculoides]